MGRCFLHRFRPDSPDKTLRTNRQGEEELCVVGATGPEKLGEVGGEVGQLAGALQLDKNERRLGEETVDMSAEE